ncbi:hypothetical protein HC776_02835 [bacterium]|nr:hypothetical protein [bacterium]
MRLLLEIDAWWHSACQRIRESIHEHNRRILTYNISLPSGFDQRLVLEAEREIQAALTRRDGYVDISIGS